MMSKQSVPIIEQDAVKSLEVVLKKIASKNGRCIALVEHRFEKIGTPEAKVVLIYDDAKCKKSTE